MMLAPTIEIFSAFTATDGLVCGGWLCWVGWLVRREANRLWSGQRFREAQQGRWIALGFFAAGGLVAYLGWASDPKGGPTLWSGVGALGWLIGAVNVWWARKTGRPFI